MVEVEDKDVVPPQAIPTPVVATRERHLLTWLDARADRKPCLLLVEVEGDTRLSSPPLSQQVDQHNQAICQLECLFFVWI
jgi:hypothetical protein